MMKRISILAFLSIMLLSCSVSKDKKGDATAKLDGSWELNFITGPRIAFEGLYPNKKPIINFNTKDSQVSGNNSCNSYTGKLVLDGNKTDFTQPMAVTKMMCLNGQGESVYMNTLQKITSYDITDDGKTLLFISGDIVMMRFTKKQ